MAFTATAPLPEGYSYGPDGSILGPNGNVVITAANAAQPPTNGMSLADAWAWVTQAAQAAGVTPGSTDAQNLAGKNPEDVAAFQQALTAQYKQRASSNGGGGAGGGTGGGASDWFSLNAPGSMPSGAPTYTLPTRPDAIASPLVAPQVTATFTAPTATDLQNSPGYQAGANLVQQGLQRSAAAQGSILNGGTQAALGRALTDYAGTQYGNLYNQYLNTYQANTGTQFQNANLALGTRQLNESAYQNDVNNSLSAFNTRYKAYQDAITNNLNLGQLGVNAASASRPTPLATS